MTPPSLFARPRFLMGVLLAAAGGAALATSMGLVHAGLTALWLRYGLSTIAGYLVFIAGITYFVRRHRTVFARRAVARRPSADGNFSLDGGFDLGVDEPVGCLVVIGLFLLAVVAFLIFNAAGFLGELAVDALVVGTAWKKLQRSMSDDFTLVLRRTVVWALLVTLAMAAAGGLLHSLAPEAVTLTDVIRTVF